MRLLTLLKCPISKVNVENYYLRRRLIQIKLKIWVSKCFSISRKKGSFDFTKLFKIFSADNKENQQVETPELPHLNSYEANLMLSQKKVAG